MPLRPHTTAAKEKLKLAARAAQPTLTMKGSFCTRAMHTACGQAHARTTHACMHHPCHLRRQQVSSDCTHAPLQAASSRWLPGLQGQLRPAQRWTLLQPRLQLPVHHKTRETISNAGFRLRQPLRLLRCKHLPSRRGATSANPASHQHCSAAQ